MPDLLRDQDTPLLNAFVLHTKADEGTNNGDTINIDGLERSSSLWKDKEVTE
jgi:hypothetical protein